MEEISLVEDKLEEKEVKMTFSMLLAHLRQKRMMTGKDTQKVRIGAYLCEFKILEPEE